MVIAIGDTAENIPDSWETEDHLVDAFLRIRSPNIRDTRNEYLVLGRAPDALELVCGELHSFEAKLKNWKKAVEQARDHQLVVDFAWILIPKAKPEWVRDTGIGLIDAGTFEILVWPEKASPLCLQKKESLIQRYWTGNDGN